MAGRRPTAKRDTKKLRVKKETVKDLKAVRDLDVKHSTNVKAGAWPTVNCKTIVFDCNLTVIKC